MEELVSKGSYNRSVEIVWLQKIFYKTKTTKISRRMSQKMRNTSNLSHHLKHKNKASGWSKRSAKNRVRRNQQLIRVHWVNIALPKRPQTIHFIWLNLWRWSLQLRNQASNICRYFFIQTNKLRECLCHFYWIFKWSYFGAFMPVALFLHAHNVKKGSFELKLLFVTVFVFYFFFNIYYNFQE